MDTTDFDFTWITYFENIGYHSVSKISSGMEGSVYMLVPNKLIAKVWTNKCIEDLIHLKLFFDENFSSIKAVKTPVIHEIQCINGTLISLENYIEGTSLEDLLIISDFDTYKLAQSTIINALYVLSEITIDKNSICFRVFDETTSFWKTHTTWKDAMMDLVCTRVLRFKHLLCHNVVELEELLLKVACFLQSRNTATMGLIHGDLCPCNIMVDNNFNLTGILDFGFLTLYGDLAFDVAICAATFNMYGNNADEIENIMTFNLCDYFGYDINVINRYKVIYALLSSNAYSLDKEDGHYQWCIKMINKHRNCFL